MKKAKLISAFLLGTALVMSGCSKNNGFNFYEDVSSFLTARKVDLRKFDLGWVNQIVHHDQITISGYERVDNFEVNDKGYLSMPYYKIALAGDYQTTVGEIFTAALFDVKAVSYPALGIDYLQVNDKTDLLDIKVEYFAAVGEELPEETDITIRVKKDIEAYETNEKQESGVYDCLEDIKGFLLARSVDLSTVDLGWVNRMLSLTDLSFLGYYRQDIFEIDSYYEMLTMPSYNIYISGNKYNVVKGIFLEAGMTVEEKTDEDDVTYLDIYDQGGVLNIQVVYYEEDLFGPEETDLTIRTMRDIEAYSGGESPDPGPEPGPTPGPEVDTITVAQAREICATLENKTKTEELYYIEGYVVSEGYDASGIATYGNMTFNIADTTTSTDYFCCFQVNYSESAQFTTDTAVQVGDQVVVYSAIYNYNGTAETTNKGSAYVYSINGEPTGSTTPGGGGEVSPYAAEVLQFANDLATSIFGEVGDNVQYGSDSHGDFYVVGVLAESSTIAAAINEAIECLPSGCVQQTAPASDGEGGYYAEYVSASGHVSLYLASGEDPTQGIYYEIYCSAADGGSLQSSGSSTTPGTGTGTSTGGDPVAGATVTLTPADFEETETSVAVNQTVNGITIQISTGSIINNNAHGSQYNTFRVNAGNTMTISSTLTIISITLVDNGENGKGISNLSADGYNSSTGVWTGSETSVTFTTGSQTRLISIAVTFAA